MKSYSPIDNIRRTAYPNILLTGGAPRCNGQCELHHIVRCSASAASGYGGSCHCCQSVASSAYASQGLWHAAKP